MGYRKIVVLGAVLVAFMLSLLNPSGAQAVQPGSQAVHVTSASWSPAYVSFACGYGYNVPVGGLYGENMPNPNCGGTGASSEPSHVWVGPGWCVTRWIGTSGAREYFAGGGSGGWHQLWSANQTSSYTNHIETWYGSWCPTSGATYETGWDFS